MNLSLSQIHSCINKCLTSQKVLKITAPGHNMWQICNLVCPPLPPCGRIAIFLSHLAIWLPFCTEVHLLTSDVALSGIA